MLRSATAGMQHLRRPKHTPLAGLTHILSSEAAAAVAILRGKSSGTGAWGRDGAASESSGRLRAARLLGMEFSPITEGKSLNPICQMGTIPSL